MIRRIAGNKNEILRNVLKQYSIPLFFGLVFFMVHFIVNIYTNLSGGFGIFRDELYYIACSDHLAFGYVDHPPLSVFLLYISRFLFGDSLPALRVFPALAGAATIFFTGLMVKKLDGNRYAQSLACLAMVISPSLIAASGVYSMNCFDYLFWSAAFYIMILIIRDNSHKLWLVLGLVLGLGLLNKISVLWLGCGITAGILFTPLRKKLLTKSPWQAAGIALAIFSPYIIWQLAYKWPTLEFIHNATVQKMASVSIPGFIKGQAFLMHILTLPIWLLGLYALFFTKDGKKYKALGIAWLTIFFILLLYGKSRTGYLGPAYPMLMAFGAVYWGKILNKSRGIKSAVRVVLLVGGILTVPLVLPVLPVESHIKYSGFFGVTPETSEKKELGKLSQGHADRFGWEEMVRSIARVYNSLTEQEKKSCAVLLKNYGEAGAVDFFGKKHGLPRATCGHNNYWYWLPEKNPGIVIMFTDKKKETLEKYAGEVILGGEFTHPYCMPYENHKKIYILKNLKFDLKKSWRDFKVFD